MTTDEMVKVGRRDHGRQGALLHLPHDRQAGGAALPRPRGHRRARRPRASRASRRRVPRASRSTSRTSFIVPGFNPGMPVINKPPIGLTDQEILAVIAYLQSLGGKAPVTLELQGWRPRRPRPSGAAGDGARSVARVPELAGRPGGSSSLCRRAVALLKRRAARSSWTLACWARDLRASCASASATPMPSSVVQHLHGRSRRWRSSAYVTSSPTRRAGFLGAARDASSNEPRLAPAARARSAC